MARKGERRDYTNEDVIQIKKENKRKLDEILAMENYQIYLGKKYYGERWFTVLEDDHFEKVEHRKRVNKFGSQIKGYIDRPINQMDIDGNFLREWDSARVWAEEHKDELNNPYAAAQHIGKCASGKGDTAYGYRWEFKIDYTKEL